jgi:2-polyprenyl-3-methyl-5-hydroxy-6-metoxy-1,4-benzoquinol methylase
MARCASTSCGLLWLDPAPLGEDLPLAYRTYYTHASRRSRPAFLDAPTRWVKEGCASARLGYRVPFAPLKRLLALALVALPDARLDLDRLSFRLAPQPGGRLLDVGCGEGRAIEWLSQLGWNAEGVDFDRSAVGRARERGLRVALGSIHEQAYPSESFDAVTLSHVIEHVPEPASLLSECRRVLRPGGVLALVTPNASSLGHARFAHAWRGLEPPRHLQIFTSAALHALVERSGLRVTTLESDAGGAAFLHRESSGHPGIGRVPTAVRRAANAFASEERARLRTDPWAGEELILRAVRD